MDKREVEIAESGSHFELGSFERLDSQSKCFSFDYTLKLG